jgi:hypothetical protein
MQGQSETPIDLNSEGTQKLQLAQWLISTTPPEINQLEGLWHVNPSLRCSVVAVGIAARQEHPAIQKLCFAHEVPPIIKLARHHQKFSASRIKDLNLLASARCEQSQPTPG